MDKITAWITEKFQHPLSLLFFILGALLVLLGVTTSIDVPILNQLKPDANFKWVSLVVGVIFLAISIIIYYRPPQESPAQESKKQAYLPLELHSDFPARRDGLSPGQRRLLGFLEEQGLRGMPVSQETIETKFNRYPRAETYFRLEQLRLLGFLEKEKIGQTNEGFERFIYRLSPAYRKEFKGD